MSVSSDLARKHEEDVAKLLGGRCTKASGSIWNDQMDGRHSYHNPWAWAWDGKCTRRLSIGVTRLMWAKAIEQSHGLRPALPLRFYDSDRGQIGLDLIVVSLADFAELRAAALVAS